jgi:hypothetical protein
MVARSGLAAIGNACLNATAKPNWNPMKGRGVRGLRLNLVRTLLSPAIATVLAFAPLLAQAQDGPGLTGADSYESPTYGFEDDGSINMWLYRFATDKSASEWFDDLAESLQLEENVAPDLGDESLGYATVIDLGAADDATGFVVYVLTGQYVVLIDANAVGGVELATVEDLLEEQLACLNAGVCDDPVPVPDELSGGDALD